MSAERGDRVLRVGIVGAGWIAGSHAAVLSARDDVIIAAVCDTDPARAAALAGPSAAAVFGDWSAMIDATVLDAVWVCTPPRAHAGPAIAAANRGLAIYLEKPVARTLDDAQAIAAATERNQTVCAVGYQWHATEVLDSLRSALDGHPIGLLAAHSIGGTQSRPWFLDRAAGGGNLLERGSHHIDLARAIAGEVVAVQAAAGTVRMAPRPGGDEGDIDDAVTVLLHFASGATGTIVIAWTADSVPGSYGVQAVAADALVSLDLAGNGRMTGTVGGVSVTAEGQQVPFERSIGRFLDAVRAGQPGQVFCTPADAVRTLSVASAAEQALLEGRTVRVAIL